MFEPRLITNRLFVRVKIKKAYYEWLKNYGDDPGLPDKMIGEEILVAMPSFMGVKKLESNMNEGYLAILGIVTAGYYSDFCHEEALNNVGYKDFKRFFDIKIIDTCIDMGRTPFNKQIKSMKYL
ncbi:MAG: hypothetical protein PQJ59_13920 [Spirochaetales bacterium]|nr:hypothetical protein [Spirochaetales bacterium]